MVESDVKLRRKFNWYERLWRIIRYRLVIPQKRSRHAPEHIARGVMVGTVWAMTPTIGLQMMLVFITWVITRKLFKWDFSLINGLAWTWTTNVFTMLPVYFVFYITGQIMLGHFDDLAGYHQFLRLWEGGFHDSAGFWQSLVIWFDNLIIGWGVPLVIGSIPWAIVCGWAAYRLSYNFIIRHRERRQFKPAGPAAAE
ncbi:MAG TPA: DUF2062 domain-containing protein [Rhodobacteraceae bacterium]|nr:DUF2062 domain-containing protein [Paracoccaceae bacterium]